MSITSHKLRRLLLIMLFCSLIFAGCRKSDDAPSETTPEHSSDASNAYFEALADEIFQTELAENTLNLHYTLVNPEEYGITNYTVSLGDYSKESELAAYSSAENYLSRLSDINYENLNTDNQLTYDILSYSLEMQIAGGQYNLFDEPLSPTIGTQAQLPVLLAEYTFYSKSDAEEYTEILNLLPEYYESLLEFQQRKAAGGLFMADYAVDDIVAQCNEFIRDPETNYLLEIFEEKVDALEDITPEESAALKEANRLAVQDSVIPAYENLIAGLTALKGNGTNEMGLCYYQNGTAYYEYLVKKSTGSSRTIDELKTLVSSQMTSDLLTMSDILAEDSSLITKVDSYEFELEDPMEMLAVLQERMQEDFPAAPEVNYEVKYVHESLQEHLSPAFYLVPPIDDSTNNVIYINRANSYEKLDLFTTLAHEGYPGHLYQTVYSAETSTHNIRSILNFSGYVEGWATYVEMYAYQMSGLEENLAALLQVNNSFILALYANIDIGVHYDGWTIEDTNDYLIEFGINNESVAQDIYYNIVEEPANYLKYYIGYAEFMSLRSEYEEEKGDEFNLKDFHEQIITIGPAPFDILKSYMN